jgi:hypothetical protein
MLNIPDIVGWTPLHIACYYKRPDVILLLLKNSANLFTKDREGITPLDLVFDNSECLKVINNFLAINKDHLDKTIIQVENSVYSFNPKHNLKKIYFKKLVRNKTNNFSCGDIMEHIHSPENNNQSIFKNYKFIPKKHKFFHNFNNNNFDHNIQEQNANSNLLKKMKTAQEYEYLSSNRQEDNYSKINTLNKIRHEYEKENKPKPGHYKTDSLIKTPRIFPEVKQFHGVKYKDEISDYNTHDVKVNKRLHNLYLASNESDNESLFEDVIKYKSENIFKNIISHRQRNRSQIITKDYSLKSNNEDTICINDDNSISLSEKLPYYNLPQDPVIVELLNLKIIDKPETDQFLNKNKFGEILFKSYGCTANEVDDLICLLLSYDFKFGLLLFLSFGEVPNCIENFVNFLRKNNMNKNLLGLILSNKDFNFSHIYFNSFDFEKTNLRDSLKKCFKSKII